MVGFEVNTMTLQKRIDNMNNGQTIKLGTRTWVEKSGNGKTLRFVRRDGNVETVYHKVNLA